jgi:hypothetical protein
LPVRAEQVADAVGLAGSVLASVAVTGVLGLVCGCVQPQAQGRHQVGEVVRDLVGVR